MMSDEKLSARKLCRVALLGCAALALASTSALGQPVTAATLWDVPRLTNSAPRVRYGAATSVTQEIWYEGEPFGGKPTWVFAYLGRPAEASTTSPAAAMLLVHGGGGKAFRDWAEHWAARGYVALAMDTAGQGSDGHRHAEAGPEADDATKFRNFTVDEAREMWTYHAVSAILRGHGLLNSLPEVDKDRVGISGISWGGYLTCMVAGLDPGLKVAVPVYGCGFLNDNSAWRDKWLAAMNNPSRELWLSLFDPSAVMAQVRCPILFMNGMHDFAYPPDSHRKTYMLVPPALRTLSIRVDLPHGHYWNFPEVDAFIDYALQPHVKHSPLARLSDINVEETSATAWLLSGEPATRAELHYTSATDHWTTVTWTSIPAQVKGTEISAALPAERPLAAFFTVRDSGGLLTSTPYVDLPKP